MAVIKKANLNKTPPTSMRTKCYIAIVIICLSLPCILLYTTNHSTYNDSTTNIIVTELKQQQQQQQQQEQQQQQLVTKIKQQLKQQQQPLRTAKLQKHEKLKQLFTPPSPSSPAKHHPIINTLTKNDNDIDLPTKVTLKTIQGNIVIQLKPNQALDSVLYIKELLKENKKKPCQNCRFYRAEPRGILQGILRNDNIPPNRKLGTCPIDIPKSTWNNNNKKAKCHGPIMTRGMVGWAAGKAGPDFFIDYYKQPADWWGHDHTVWGEIVDVESLRVVDSFFDLPGAKKSSGLRMLDHPIHIDLE